MGRHPQPAPELVYKYVEPKTEEERQRAQESLNRAFNVVFEEMRRRGLLKSGLIRSDIGITSLLASGERLSTYLPS
jgi:hypothetical protein